MSINTNKTEKPFSISDDDHIAKLREAVSQDDVRSIWHQLAEIYGFDYETVQDARWRMTEGQPMSVEFLAVPVDKNFVAFADAAIAWIYAECAKQTKSHPAGWSQEFGLAFMIKAYCAGRAAGVEAALGNDPGQAGKAARDINRERAQAVRTPPTSADGVHDNPIVAAVVAEIRSGKRQSGSLIVEALRSSIIKLVAGVAKDDLK